MLLGIHLASCCVFLTPLVFLSFAGCAYVCSGAPWGAPSGGPLGLFKGPRGRGPSGGAPQNRLMILADLTLVLTLDLLDLAAAFSCALGQTTHPDSKGAPRGPLGPPPHNLFCCLLAARQTIAQHTKAAS